MKRFMRAIKGLFRRDDGAAGVEYGVLVALIIALCVAIIASIGLYVQGGFQAVNDELEAQGVTPGTGTGG